MKRMSLTVTGLAVSAVVMGLGTVPAEAARVTGTAGVSGVRPEQGTDVSRGSHWTRGSCVAAGRQGVTRGYWTRFRCVPGYSYWILWTDR